MSVVDLSLVIPCYNEEPILAQSLEELLAVLRGTRLTYELIFVDDASRDRSHELLQAFCRRYPDLPVQIIRHPVNLGRGRTVTDGWRAARGRIIGYLDIDLEVHARYLPAMVDAIDREGYDGAVAWRIYTVSWSLMGRAMLSRGYHWLVRYGLGLPFRDTEQGYKFFTREAIMPVLSQVQDPGWFWDTELMAQAWLHGLRICEIPCRFIRRTDKRSSLRVWRDTWRYLVALGRFRRRWLRPSAQTSWLYRVPGVYQLAMALLYRQGARGRHQAVAQRIPSGSSVLDVCSGDCALYTAWLRHDSVDYLGLDLNPCLLHAGARRGARVRLMDVRQDDLPPADVVVMQASLYQFIPHQQAMLQKLLRAARRQVILVEPVQNWATNGTRWRRWLARRWTNPGTGEVPYRLARLELEQLLREHGAVEISELAGGRELMGLFCVKDERASR